MKWTFPKQILISFIVISAIAAFPLTRWGNKEILAGVVAGACLATMNILIGYASIEYCKTRSTMTFFKVVIGGMGIRLLVMLGLTALLAVTVSMNMGAFVASLGVFYLTFLVLEILHIQQTVTHKQQS